MFAGRSAELNGSDTPPRTIERYLTHMSFLYLFKFDELEHYGQRGGGHQRDSGYDGGDQRHDRPIAISCSIDILISVVASPAAAFMMIDLHLGQSLQPHVGKGNDRLRE